MIHEVIDKNSGAILFKKDADSLRYEELLVKVKQMEKQIEDLSERLETIEKS